MRQPVVQGIALLHDKKQIFNQGIEYVYQAIDETRHLFDCR